MSSPPVIVRFAPSPTGFLHIGGARTALFNWLYAQHTGGQFLLRIEDTDRARSTDESVATILDGLQWLGLTWQGEPISQFARASRHAEVAREMVKNGTAYYCYASPEELEIMRAEQKAKGLPQRYDGRWRDRNPSDAPADIKPTIRLKAPILGETIVNDKVMGTITVQNVQLDDMVLLRADGTPTYMLAVVVDDHDMGVTHVIRGDDHTTNTFRQIQIYKSMGWVVPEFAHLPLILGPDGAKFSKRHGAPAVGDYRDLGYLPEAIRNYLLRLCWAHGDDEIISKDQAIAWFDFDGIGRSPARFDFAKLAHINAHYMKQVSDADLAKLALPFIEKNLGRALDADEMKILTRAMVDIKPRAQTLIDIAHQVEFFFVTGDLVFEEQAKKLLTPESVAHLQGLIPAIENLTPFTAPELESVFRNYAESHGIKLSAIAQPLRAAITGRTTSPPIFTVAELLGRARCLERMRKALCL